MKLIDFGPAPRPDLGLCPRCDSQKNAHWFRDTDNATWYKGVFCDNEREMEIYQHDKDGKPTEGGKWSAYPRP